MAASKASDMTFAADLMLRAAMETCLRTSGQLASKMESVIPGKAELA